MNTTEQVLRKRCQTLERRTAWLEDVVRALLRDLELTESVGAAFAWDLAKYEEDQDTADHLGIDWDEAVKALEKQQGVK